jgi:hypothetical protein
MPGQVVVARTFTREVRFHCPDLAVADALRYLSAQPRMPGWPTQPLDLHIVSIGRGYYDFSQGPEGSPGTKSYMSYRADDIVSGILLDETSGDLVIAAASLLVNDRRFLVLADDYYVRLLFIMNCLSEKVRVETDGFVALRDEISLPIPRTLRIERRLAQLFPKLLSQVMSSPHLVDWEGNIIHALDPSAGGPEWIISPGRVDVLLFLEPNEGGTASTARLSAIETFERLMRGIFSHGRGRKASSFSKLHRLSREAACWKMRVGAPGGAFWHLERISNQITDWNRNKITMSMAT